MTTARSAASEDTATPEESEAVHRRRPPSAGTVTPEQGAPGEVAVAAPALKPITGPRHRRRLSRRRRIIEEVAAVLIFLVALGVTVLLLAGQWLLNASVTGTLQ